MELKLYFNKTTNNWHCISLDFCSCWSFQLINIKLLFLPPKHHLFANASSSSIEFQSPIMQMEFKENNHHKPPSSSAGNMREHHFLKITSAAFLVPLLQLVLPAIPPWELLTTDILLLVVPPFVWAGKQKWCVSVNIWHWDARIFWFRAWNECSEEIKSHSIRI